MKLAIYEHSFKELPGNATWQCMKLEKDMRPEVWGAMGWRVVEVKDSEGEELLKAMSVSINLQFKLREMYHTHAEPTAAK